MKVKSPLKEKFNIPRQDHKTTFNFVSFFILKFWRIDITHTKWSTFFFYYKKVVSPFPQIILLEIKLVKFKKFTVI